MALDVSAILGRIPTNVQAASMATAISMITGSTPSVVNRGDYHEIILDGEQEDAFSQWVLSQLNKEPGAVRVDLSGVTRKVVVRQWWPQMAGLVAAGALVGYLLRGR